MDFRVVLNGLGHAFLREFGCLCARCHRSEHAANTSASIVGRDSETGMAAWHCLVDAGLGVNDSLCNYFTPADARLDWLLFSHWHPDHTLELNRLGETARRRARNRGVKFVRIPTWCRTGTARWIQKNHSYEWYRHLRPHTSEEVSAPGALLEPVPTGIDGLTITPVTVSHYTADIDPASFKDKLYSSAVFVIETDSKKAVLLWDLDNRNNWILHPETEEHRQAQKLVSEADYLFVDSFTWSIEEVNGFNTGHLSFATIKKYAALLRPRQTLLVHMSGHEDGEGNCGYGWSDDKWEREAQKAWKSAGLAGAVRVPTIGEEFPL